MLIRTQPRHRAHRAAFTLMEMMIVVAIIVALAGIGIFYFAGQADEGDIKGLTQAVTAYKIQHGGQWPENLEVLLRKDEYGGPYIQNAESLHDPFPGNRAYNYDPSGSKNNGTQPDIWCDMPSPLGTASNWTNRIIPN
jgi:prepilin-type N-terminal cleavage/methylation domain-containing protein